MVAVSMATKGWSSSMVMGRESRTFAARGKVRLAEGRGGRGSGRRSRLQVSCRTAFEKRIEAKKSQSSNSSTGLRSTPIDVGKKKGKSDNRRNKLREKNVKADGTSSNQGKASKATPAQTKTTAVSSSQPGKAVVASQQKRTASGPPAKKGKAKAQGLRFQHDFGFGEQGPHVERLQRILLSEKYLTSRDQITGYFGRETKEAMAMWQKKNKVMASGYFGPVSRAVINKQGKLTRAKQAVAVQLVVNPVGTSAVSFSLAGIVAVSLLYLIKSKQDAGRSWLQKVAGVAENCIAYASGLQLLSFLDPNSNNTRGPQLEAASAVYKEEEERERFDAKTKRQFPGLATRNNKGEGGEQPSGREMYSQRVELRRNIASLQNELGYAEDQLKKATFLLRREKERADRAESLYLEEKSSAQLLQMENQKLKNALKTSGRR